MVGNLSLGERTPLAEGDLQLPRPPGVIRRFLARHPRVVDSIVVGFYLVFSALGFIAVVVAPSIQSSGSTIEASPGAIALRVIATLGMAAALLFRRRAPWTVLVVMWAGTLIGLIFEGSADPIAIPFALYALAVYRSARDAWVGFAASVGIGTIAAGVGVIIKADPDISFGLGTLSTSIAFAVTCLLATLIGTNIGNRKRYVAALVDRANQLARERDQQSQLAVAAERSRIAREMHDIVSHSLTVMVTLADGSAATTAADPDRAAAAMRQVAETGRDALSDMRRMLGVLHAGSDDATPAGALQPQPGIAELPALVETFRSAALPLEFSSTGVPPMDPGEQLVVYRIVQEALTNVLRHAGSVSLVTAAVSYGLTQTIVNVTDDGDGGDAGGPGHGLVGMRERVTLYGGELESGPLAAGGWHVRATIPRQAGDER
jgi:signal transduction histidine kinase